jgi:hypothetical protein
MKNANAPKKIKSFDRFNSALSEKNILSLQSMISVRGGDGEDPIIIPPPPPKNP